MVKRLALRPVAASIVTLVFSLASACTRPKPATLAVLTDLAGITEPCGCTSRPLGGLDHLAGRMETFAPGEPAGLVVVGSTFFSFAAPPPTMLVQERSKAQAIAQILRHLNPAVVVPGSLDTGIMRPDLEAVLGREPLPVQWQKSSETLLPLGRIKVGVIGIPGELDAAAINTAATSLRGAGASLVVTLVAQGKRGGGLQAGALRGVDAVVLAGDEGGPEAQPLENTVLLYGGTKGEHIGLLHLTPRDGPGWRYDDGGAAEKRSLQARRDRLQQEATQLPEGPGRQARLAKAAELEKQLQAFKAPAPQGSTFMWEAAPIEQRLPAATWAKNILTEYSRSLCAPAMEATAAQTCTPASSPGEAFVGSSQSCQACHVAAYEIYSHTAHARAWATLQRVGKECDLTCVGCHSVGFLQPGGYCHLADASTYANVGCENCHGAAAGHIAAPQDRTKWPKTLVRSPGEATCRGCHTPEHSDRFDFATYLPKILGPGHGVSAPNP